MLTAQARRLSTPMDAHATDPAERSARAAAAAPPPPAVDDTRLAPARELLASGTIDVLSLDVFDTLLWRAVPEPADAFPLVAGRLRERGMLDASVDLEAFRALRVGAEARAREALKAAGEGPEVTLSHIYAAFPRRLARGAEPEALAEAEVEVEEGLLVPDLDVLALAAEARESGKRVVVVSDTYFDSPTLRRFLARGPLASLWLDEVFASCEHGAYKSGRLFEVVLDRLAVPAGRVLHVGDNPAADVEGARRHGIAAVPYPRRPDALETLREREAPHGGSAPAPGGRGGDAGLTALRARVLNRAERDSQPDELLAFWDYGAAVLGPVLAGFAAWVHRRAADHGAERVFCLMREGALLADLIASAGPGCSSELEAEPLWLSRQVCARAAIIEGTRDELRELTFRQRKPTAAELFATLGLERSDLGPLERHADARLDQKALLEAVVDRVVFDPALHERVVDAARAHRGRIVRYLRSRAGADARRVVLVDLGWGATIQSLLDRILEAEGERLETVGLYLVTNERAGERMLDGTLVEGFLGEIGHPEPHVASLMRSPELLEQACMPEHGTQVDIDQDLRPVLAPAGDDLLQAAERHALQQGIRSFLRLWSRYRAAVPGAPCGIGEAAAALRAILVRSVLAPVPDEAALFARWSHDQNFGSQDSQSIVAGDAAGALLHVDPRGLAELPMDEVYWPFALAAMSDPALARAAEQVATGQAGWDLFASGLETGPVGFETGGRVGFGPEGRAEAHPRRNRHGNSLVRVELRSPGIRRLRIRPVRSACVLRIDRITLACWLEDVPEPVRVDLSSEAELAGLSTSGLERIAGRVWLSRGGRPSIVVDVAGLTAGAVWRVDAELAFAVMPIPPAPDRALAVRAQRRAGRFAREHPRARAPLTLTRRIARRLRRAVRGD